MGVVAATSMLMLVPPALAASPSLGSRVLRQGMSGADVRALTRLLNQAGYPTPPVRTFGTKTEKQVRSFERAQHLAVTGVVNKAFVRKLRHVVASRPGSPASEDAHSGGAPVARINPDGRATAPGGAPRVVYAVVAAANQIIGKPYVYSGGHGTWDDAGYDCSGAVSYALHGGGLLASPEDSAELESYGDAGTGRWITIYADPTHAWVVVAGIAFDTADFGGPNVPAGTGPRWRSDPVGNLADGGRYVQRHPSGL